MANRNSAKQTYKPVSMRAAQAGLRVVRPQPLRQSLSDWTANHASGYSELEAYNLATGKRQTIAEVMGASQIDVEQVADYMAETLSQADAARELIGYMADALEKCIECRKTMTWDAEHEADVMIRRARAFLDGQD